MPTKQSEIRQQIWTALYGYNGETGVIARLEKLENRPRDNALKRRDKVYLALGLIGGASGVAGILAQVGVFG